MNNYFKSYKTIFQATQDISKLERETKCQGQALLKGSVREKRKGV